jgi:hypothetical protein
MVSVFVMAGYIYKMEIGHVVHDGREGNQRSISIQSSPTSPRLSPPAYSSSTSMLDLGQIIIGISVLFFLIASYAVLLSGFMPATSMPVRP